MSFENPQSHRHSHSHRHPSPVVSASAQDGSESHVLTSEDSGNLARHLAADFRIQERKSAGAGKSERQRKPDRHNGISGREFK